MIKLYTLFVVFFFLMDGSVAYAQTQGIGEVTAVESKYTTIEANQQKIARYRSELVESESIWRSKLQKLKDELAALQKDRDNLLADMRVGAKCSECGTYKSEFEKKGIDFKKHLGEVKGYAVPATTTELDATRAKYAEQIAYKKVQIQNMEKGDNIVNDTKNKIAALEKENTLLCNKITQHSKDYETKVMSEAKTKHNLWVDELMNYASSILISEDRLSIFKARILRYENEFQQESSKAKERLKEDMLRQQQLRSDNLAKNAQRAADLQAAAKTFLSPRETELSAMLQKRDELARELSQPKISDSTKRTLTATQKQLLTDITAAQKTIKDYKTDLNTKIIALDTDNKRLKDEIVQLSAGLAKQQQQETARLKISYDQKKQEASQAETKETTTLANARKTYTDKANGYKKQQDQYLELIGAETARMTIASQKINCPVWNSAKGMVSTNWNQVFPCVNSITTQAKPYSTNVFNSYCPGKSASSYLAAYKSFLGALSAEDKEVVRLNSNVGWFELMTK